MRRARGHQNTPALQRAIRQLRLYRRNDLERFGHTARAEFPAGHITVVGSDYADAVTAQYCEVALRCRVIPHAHIHRRRDQHRRIRRQQ